MRDALGGPTSDVVVTASMPPPPVPDRSDLEAVRVLLMRLIADGQVDDAVALVMGLLSDLREENLSLLHRLREALRRLYGRSSEKLTPTDAALLARVLGPEATPPGGDAPTGSPASSDGGTKPSRPLPEGAAHGRGSKPEGLPETRTRRPVPEGQRACPQCGGALHPFGHLDSWQVEYVPGHFVVNTTQREQLSCRRCRDVVVTAPAPPKVIPSGEPGPGLLARVLVDKGEDHLPLERQQRRMAREGWTVPATTLSDWWAQAADLLRPLHGALEREAMHAWLPQIDATGIDVLDRDHPQGIRQGPLWTAVGGRAVVFTYTPVKGEGLGAMLAYRAAVDRPPGSAEGGDEEGVAHDEGDDLAVQARSDEGVDAPSAPPPAPEEDAEEAQAPETERGTPNGAEGPPGRALRAGRPVQCDGENLLTSVQARIGVAIVLVHCWMHARRYFERAMKAKDLRATVAMQLIGQMYDVERRATEEAVGPEERARRRQAQTWPLLERLREWIEEIRPKVPPSTPLGKAIRYVERRWLSLCVFVLDGRIPIDNGEVERQIRRIAVGRRNWLFTKGDRAARRLCTVASLCATCRKLGIDPWEYLRDVLLVAGSGISAKALAAGFTPWAWAEKKAQKADAEKGAVAA